ncbi:MAG: class I SAM-dependent methyltransferase [Cellulosilyticum sp.]|nr:class I SAM-dependent methyltransferase [Cellulosilyticum sp.]
MKNPWEIVQLDDYENHMALPNVGQLQALSQIMKRQFNQYHIQTVAIWGVAGGNGLEHIKPKQFKKIYGIDINQAYLHNCREKYADLREDLICEVIDLTQIDCILPKVELIVANLLIEYIGIETFTKQVLKVHPKYVSCVIQKNIDKQFVSDSPYIKVFDDISVLHQDIDEESLKDSMHREGYKHILRRVEGLPNGKQFIRLDFRLEG